MEFDDDDFNYFQMKPPPISIYTNIVDSPILKLMACVNDPDDISCHGHPNGSEELLQEWYKRCARFDTTLLEYIIDHVDLSKSKTQDIIIDSLFNVDHHIIKDRPNYLTGLSFGVVTIFNKCHDMMTTSDLQYRLHIVIFMAKLYNQVGHYYMRIQDVTPHLLGWFNSFEFHKSLNTLFDHAQMYLKKEDVEVMNMLETTKKHTEIWGMCTHYNTLPVLDLEKGRVMIDTPTYRLQMKMVV